MRNWRSGILLFLTIGVISFAGLLPSPVEAASVVVKKTWGGSQFDVFSGVATDSSGNVYAAGYTYSYGAGSPSYPELIVVKYSPAGTLLWQRIWTNTSSDFYSFYGEAVAVDPAGGVYVTGSLFVICNNIGTILPYVVKFDSGGNLVWQEKFSPCIHGFRTVAISARSNAIYITGTTNDYGAGSSDIVLFKLNSTGAVQWQKTWGGSSSDTSSGLTVDSAGNIYLVGYTSSFGVSFPSVLLKIDPSGGSLLYQKLLGPFYAPSGVGVDSSGNVYIGGEGGAYVEVIKFDATSGFQWAKTWGGSNGSQVINGLTTDQSGNTFITGRTNSYGAGGTCTGYYKNTCYALFLGRLNSTGEMTSNVIYGGLNDTIGGAVAVDSSGNAAVVGYVSGAPPYYLGSGNNTVGTGSVSISTVGNSTLGLAHYTTQALSGPVGQPSGSESYAGRLDGLLLKYGTLGGGTPLSPISIFIAILAVTPLAVFRRRRRR